MSMKIAKIRLSAETVNLLQGIGDDVDSADAYWVAKKIRQGEAVYSYGGGILVSDEDIRENECNSEMLG